LNSPPPPPVEELAHWRGGVDAFRDNTGEHFKQVDKKLEKLDERQDEFDREMATMKVKVAAGAAIGSIIGGGIVTFIFAIASKAVGG
jgi:uncharacterized membrane protein YjjP (DUF1212 family)